jgi:hypothetical protein
MTKLNGKKRRDIEDGLDKALDDSFPASDPPSQSNPVRSTKRVPERLKSDDVFSKQKH